MNVDFKDIEKNFDEDSKVVVRYGSHGIPAEFFKISKYMWKEFSRMYKTHDGFVTMMENPRWWEQKSNEYKEYLKSGNDKVLRGLFWKAVKEKYGSGGIAKILNPTRIYNLDSTFDRKAFRKYLLKETETEKEKEKDEVAFTLESDGYHWDERDREMRRDLDWADEYDEQNDGTSAKDQPLDRYKTKKTKGNKMNVKDKAINEVKELWNVSGAADIALGKILYSNIKSAFGKTVIRISFLDTLIGTVNKKMKIKNEVTELVAVLGALVIMKQFYEHKALENVRGYIVNRLYTITIESTGFDDVIALINSQDKKVTTEA